MHSDDELIGNLEKIRKTVRKGQILAGEVISVLNDRDILIKIQGKIIKAYTNIPFSKGDRAYLQITQVKKQLRFKLLTEQEYNRIVRGGIDFTC